MRALLFLVFTTLALSGCGDAAPNPSPREATKAERPKSTVVHASLAASTVRHPIRRHYARRVNALCARQEAQLRAIGPPRGSIVQQRAIAHRINLASLHGLEEMRKIAPPRADRAQLEATFDKLSHALKLADFSTRALTTHTRAANRAALRGATELLDVNQRLADFGLTTCAE